MTNSVSVASREAAALSRPVAQPEEMLQDLYERYCGQINGFCLRQLGSREDAEDATQVTFLNAFRGLARGAAPEYESAWLFRIAHNVCLNSLRASFRRRRVEMPGDLDVIEEAVPARAPDTEALVGLWEVLQSLPESQRRAIVLREWQGLSYREIGAELDLSQSAVETLLFRARRAVAAGLAEQPSGNGNGDRPRRASAEAGSLVAALKSLALGTVVKLVSGLATIAATSAVTTSPDLQHALSHDLSSLTGSQVWETGHVPKRPARHATSGARSVPVHPTGAAQPTAGSTSPARSTTRPAPPTTRPVRATSSPAPPSTLPPASVRRPVRTSATGSNAGSTRAGRTTPGPSPPSRQHSPPVIPAVSEHDQPQPVSGPHTPTSDSAGPTAQGGMPSPAESSAETTVDEQPPRGIPKAAVGEVIPAPAGAVPPPSGTPPPFGDIDVPDPRPGVAASAPAGVPRNSGHGGKPLEEDARSLPTRVASGDPPVAAPGRSARDAAPAGAAADTRNDTGNDTPPPSSAAADDPSGNTGDSSGNTGDQPEDPPIQAGDTASRPGDGAESPSADRGTASATGSAPGIGDSTGRPGNSGAGDSDSGDGIGDVPANGNTDHPDVDPGPPSHAGGGRSSDAAAGSSSAGNPNDHPGHGAGRG